MISLHERQRQPDRYGKGTRFVRKFLATWAFVLLIVPPESLHPDATAKDGVAEQGEARTDLSGDPLPASSIARMGSLRFWAGAPISSISFAPDRRTVAATSEGYSGFVSIWDVDTGRSVYTLPDGEGGLPVGFSSLGDIAHSPDGRYLAACGNETVVVWELATRRVVYSLRGQAAGISDPVFARNGLRLATSGGDQTVCVWSLTNGQQIRRFPFRDRITAFALSTDGSILGAAWRDQSTKLWKVDSGQIERSLPGRGLAGLVGFAPDGSSIVSVGDNGLATAYDITTGKVVRQIHLDMWTHSNRAALSSDSKLVAVGRDDASILVWETSTGRRIRRIQLGPWNIAHRIAFSHDGKTIAAAQGDDSVLQLWDLASGKERAHFLTHRGGASHVSFSPDGKVVAVSDEAGEIVVWDVLSGKEIRRITDGPRQIWDVPMKEDDRRLLCARIGPSGYIAFSADGQTILSVGRDGSLRFWNARSGALVKAIALDHGAQIGPAAFSPATRLIAVSSAGGDTIGVWDTITGGLIRRVSTKAEGAVRAVTLSSDARAIAAAGDDRSVRLWDATEMRLLDCFLGAQDSVHCVAFSPDRALICAGGLDGVLRLWRADGGGGQTLPVCPHPCPRGIRAIAFSPDSKRFACGGDDCIVHVWGIGKAEESCTFKGHRGAISSLAFSQSSSLIASASADGTVLIWDTRRVASHR